MGQNIFLKVSKGLQENVFPRYKSEFFYCSEEIEQGGGKSGHQMFKSLSSSNTLGNCASPPF